MISGCGCGQNGCSGLSAQVCQALVAMWRLTDCYAAKGLIGPAGNGRWSDAMPLLPYATPQLFLPVDHSGGRPVLPG